MELRDFCGNGRTVAALGELFRQGRLPPCPLPGRGGRHREENPGPPVCRRGLCTAPQGERPCGRCLACDKVERGIHPDVLMLTGGKGSRSFHVDSIRRLRQEAYLAPNEGRMKVFLLLDAHTMTVQAQNALLKVIEDPPQASLFVLTVRSRRQLLPTILSRVVTFSLEAPSPEDCARGWNSCARERTPPPAGRRPRRPGAMWGRPCSCWRAGRSAPQPGGAPAAGEAGPGG